MVDSDDDYNRSQNNSNQANNRSKPNRDKFYKERDDPPMSNNNNMNNNNMNNNYRRDWSNDRGRPNNDGFRQGGGPPGQQQRGRNDYSSRKHGSNQDSSPPPYKRRRDWDSNVPDYSVYNNNNNSYGGMNKPPMQQQQYQSPVPSHAEPEYPTQPPMLSFKQFLQQQDDSISDEIAIKKYNDYKVEFKKTQINKFFLDHREEEWFKYRYHPDEYLKRRNEHNQHVVNRLDVFMDLKSKGALDGVSCDMDKAKELTRLLDTVVIKLEGGSDEDVTRLLDGPASKSESKGENQEGDEVKEIKHEENGKSEGEADKEKSGEEAAHSGSESGAYSEDDEEEEDDDTGNVKRKKKHRSKNGTNGDASTNGKSSHDVQVKQLHKTVSIFMRNLPPNITKQDLESVCKHHEGFKRIALSDPAPERGFFRRGWVTFDANVDVKKICWSLQNIKIKDHNPGAIVNRELSSRIRAITSLASKHKTAVRNDIKLAMRIIKNMDKRWNLWQDADSYTQTEEPENEKSFTQNDSITQDTSINAEEKAGEGGAEGSLQQQETDMAKLEIQAYAKLSSRGHLYVQHKFIGSNPILENITDYLVDEVNAEEEELLGGEQGEADQDHESRSRSTKSTAQIPIDEDLKLNQVLDTLVLYLRIVHSIDFYNSAEYQQEDSMPNRCGIMFVRPSVPTNAAMASLRTTLDEIEQYSKQFEIRLKPYLEYKEKIEADLAKKLGIKEHKDEIDKFIKVNTQELAPDRWLCPLSGKRFKGPEFIRKHLFYKHMDKIMDVKKEVEYFNNYIYDPKRPQLPEHPSNRSSSTGSSAPTHTSMSPMSSGPTSHHQYQPSNNYNWPSGNMANQMGGNSYGGGMGGRSNWNQQSGGGGGYMGGDYNQSGGAGGYGGGYNMYGMNQQQQYGGYNQQGGYKRHHPYGGGGSGGPGGFRRGGNREMIQYKDLDAPDEN